MEGNVACMKADGLMGYVQNGRHWVCSQNMVGGRFWGSSFIRKLKASRRNKDVSYKRKQKFFNFL